MGPAGEISRGVGADLILIDTGMRGCKYSKIHISKCVYLGTSSKQESTVACGDMGI